MVTGYAGGSGHREVAGLAEYICLPENPQWKEYRSGLQGQAYVYGAEYQTREGYNSDYFFDLSNNNGQTLFQHDVPCVLCRVTGRGNVFTFPALNECPDEWHFEYGGYLMAPSLIDNQKQQAKPICMDEAPEVVRGGQANRNGALFYMVEARCGSLPCPNYVEGRELTCTVCTR